MNLRMRLVLPELGLPITIRSILILLFAYSLMSNIINFRISPKISHNLMHSRIYLNIIIQDAHESN